MLVTLGHFLNRCTLYSVQFTFILFAVLCSVSKTAGDMALKLKTIHTKIFLFFYIFLVNFVCNFRSFLTSWIRIQEGAAYGSNTDSDPKH